MYKKILLKLSGEALMGELNYGIDPVTLSDYAGQIREIAELGVNIGIVIGGGNIFRGIEGLKRGVNRIKGDQMGMLATVINGLALQSALEKKGLKARTFSAINMEPVCEFYNKNKVLEAFSKGEVALLTAGTGNPFFTTDTAASLRAIEIEAEVLLKGTRVDGVYSADPEKDKTAKKFKKISFNNVYKLGLQIMDLTAFTLCKENNLPVIVFNMNKKGNLKRIILGENIGTIVSG
jgi:uridylate kinase